MAKTLLDWETIDSHQIDDIMAGKPPRPPKPVDKAENKSPPPKKPRDSSGTVSPSKPLEES